MLRIPLRTHRSVRPLACLIIVFLMVIAPFADAQGEIIIAPALTVGEEYNDNVYLSQTDAKTDYITHVVPSIGAAYQAPLWDWKLSYSYDYRYYAYKSYEDDHPQILDFLVATRLVKDLLYFDVRDHYGRTSLTTVQDYTKQSLVQNLTDYNSFDLNPYAALQLTSRLTLTAGYQYRNLWYKDPTAIDQTINSVYFDLARSTAERTSLTALGRYDETVTSDSTQRRARFLVGGRYEFSEGSHLWGSIGAIKTSASGSSTGAEPAWEAGIISSTPTTSFSIETGRTFVEDPRVINRREDRYVAAFRIGKERTSGGVSAGLWNYGQDSNLTDRRYSTTVDFSHFLTEKMFGKYALSIDRYERYPADGPDTTTIVYITDLLFEYHLSENTVLSLSYVYTDSYSATVYLDNYSVNRVLLAARMNF